MDRTFVNIGEKVLYEEKECVIIRVVDMNIVTIEEVFTNIVHTIPISAVRGTKSFDKQIPVSALPEKDWERARGRYDIIRPILSKRGDLDLIRRISEERGVSIPTIYRWLAYYDSTGLVSSLAGKKRTGGQGKSRLLEVQDEIIDDKIHEVYLNKSRKSLVKLIREIKLRCQELGVKAPHDNTIRNRVKNISEEEKVRKRYGLQEARYKFEPHLSNYDQAQTPLSVVQIDHTKVDIILVDERHRQPLFRPWLTVALDVYSRMVLGFYLSFDSPGALGTGVCIANSILPKELWLSKVGINANWPCWGVMDVIHVDNAKEFRGITLKKACENYGINLEFRPVATPHYGGHIERLMGTFAKEIHDLPGTTFSSAHERKKYKSEEQSSFTLEEFERWLTIYITKIYHERVHSTIGTSPLNRFREGIMGTREKPGRGVSPRINNHRKTRLDFLPAFERSVQEYGIVIDHIYYYDDVLRPYVNRGRSGNKDKFIFKRDPRDISVIFFLDPVTKEYFDIPYRNVGYPPMSIWEHREMLKRLKETQIEVSEEAIFDSYRELNEIESEAMRLTRKTRKVKEYDQVRRVEEKGEQSFVATSDIIDILPFEDLDDETFNRQN